jgi:phosphoglycerate dehydrogenase-like enzyme
MRAGAWQTRLGTGLHGKTLGIVGLGRIGQRIVELCHTLGMTAVAWSRSMTPEKAHLAGVHAASLDSVLAEADVISLHLVLGPETRHLIGRREIGLMKPTTFLVNTSRGPVVEEAALFEALREGRIAGAALDVYETEPLPPNHPFRRLDNLLLTPHSGYATREMAQLFYGQVIENIRAFAAGTPIRILPFPDVSNAAHAR